MLALLAVMAVPTYLRAQRDQKLLTATQGLEGAISALRNQALTGRQVNGALPDGYCLRVLASGTRVDAISFTDVNSSGFYDAGDTFETLSPHPVAVPELDTTLRGVTISHVLIGRGGVFSEPAIPALAQPLLCFAPPRAGVIVATDAARLTPPPLTLSYELTIDDPLLEVMKVQVDTATGQLRTTTTLSRSDL